MSDLKIVLLGSSGAGKTCLVQRLVTGKFNQKEQSTMGASFLQKSYKSRTGETFEFAIWDTAGQERFDSLSTFYTRDAGCAIIVYDMTSNNSFRDLDRMFPKLESASQGCFVILVGSKVDIVKEDQKKEKFPLKMASKLPRNTRQPFLKALPKLEKIQTKFGRKSESNLSRQKRKKKKEINKENEPQDNNIIKIDQPSDNETEKKKEKKKRKEDGGGCC